MEPKEFEIGDVVKLKSGGHPMTVLNVEAERVTVAHYTDSRFTRQHLPPAAIVVVLEPPTIESVDFTRTY